MKYLKFILIFASFVSFPSVKLSGMVEFNQQTIEVQKKQKTPFLEKWLYKRIVNKQALNRASPNADTFGKWAFWLGIAGLGALIVGTLLFLLLLKSLVGLVICTYLALILSIIAIKLSKNEDKDSRQRKRGKSIAYLVLAITLIPIVLSLVMILGMFHIPIII